MKLYQEIILLKEFFKGKWVVENVKPYYPMLIPGKEIERHLFWSNFRLSTFKVSKPIRKNIIDTSFDELVDWLGFPREVFEKSIYFPGSHDRTQVVRNCVHPEIGLHIFNCAQGIMNYKSGSQMTFCELDQKLNQG